MGLKEQREILQKLGKYSTGKGCLYVNKLKDIDKTVLKKSRAWHANEKSKMNNGMQRAANIGFLCKWADERFFSIQYESEVSTFIKARKINFNKKNDPRKTHEI